MGPAPVARVFPALLLALAAAGCAAVPPDWAYFDVDRHPVGAAPAQAGYYVGAYVVAPPVLFCFLGLSGLGGSTDWGDKESWKVMEEAAGGFGVTTGLILGAPFHLLALPFGSRGPDEPEPPSYDVPGPVGSPGYDDVEPKIPRDYPWPPKPAGARP